MKLLLILTLLSLSIHRQEAKYPKEFKIGAYSYVITLKKGYNHDDDVTATYFVVNFKGNKNNQISAYKMAEHKGKNTTIGSYRITEKLIEFKEVFFDQSIDSMIKRYYPNKKGILILTEYTDYKKGVGKRIHL